MIPIQIISIEYVDLKDIIVVNVPDPEIKGKAIGIMLPDWSFLSDLNNSMFKIISIAKRKITIAPAIAKDDISIPIIWSIFSPKNKKIIIIKPDARVALPDSIFPIFDLNEIIIGIDPKISIIAKALNLLLKFH